MSLSGPLRLEISVKSLRILAAFLASDFRLDGMGLLTANKRTQRNGQFVAYRKIKAILRVYCLLPVLHHNWLTVFITVFAWAHIKFSSIKDTTRPYIPPSCKPQGNAYLSCNGYTTALANADEFLLSVASRKMRKFGHGRVDTGRLHRAMQGVFGKQQRFAILLCGKSLVSANPTWTMNLESIVPNGVTGIQGLFWENTWHIGPLLVKISFCHLYVFSGSNWEMTQ